MSLLKKVGYLYHEFNTFTRMQKFEADTQNAD